MIKVSDVFLNMKLGTEKDGDAKKDNDEDDADFERDEEDEVENVQEDDAGDTDKKSKNSQRLIRNVSVKIYTKKGQGKKKKKSKK